MDMICLVLFGLVAAGNAAPPSLFNRQAPVCNRDNCYRAIVASNAKPGPVTASNDCASFFRQTVTPCPVTIMRSTTLPATDPTSTVTSTSTTVIVTTSISTSVATTTSTEAKSTTVSTSTITPFTTTTTVTSTEVISTTVTRSLAEPEAGPAKRQIVERGLIGRQAPACTAVTRSANSVPTYASACSGVVRYSSACNCIGATVSKTTLAAATSIVVSTYYSTTTPVTTASTVLTVVTTTSALVITTTGAVVTETKTSTVTITSTSTMTESATTTETSTSVATETTQPRSGDLVLNAYANGANLGVLSYADPTAGDTQMWLNQDSGAVLLLDERSRLIASGYDEVYALAVYGDVTGFDPLYDSFNAPDSQDLRCRIANPIARTGKVTCNFPDGPTQNFFNCRDQPAGYSFKVDVIYVGNTNGRPEDCVQVDLRASPR